MDWLKRLFKKESTFVGDPVTTGDELIALASSNPIVAAELTDFEKRVNSDGNTSVGHLEQEAFRSAEALSGYGLLVSKQAFLEVAELH